MLDIKMINAIIKNSENSSIAPKYNLIKKKDGLSYFVKQIDIKSQQLQPRIICI